jgi:putative ABC transport system permease protein
MKDLGTDILYAWRQLARSPGFAATAVLLVALGTGANFAIYSILDAVLLRPLPFAQPDRLAEISETGVEDPARQLPVSVPDFFDWRQQSGSFEGLEAFHPWSFNLTGSGEPERLSGGVMTAGLPALLGVRPLAGRTFAVDEQGPGGKPLVLLGEDLWKRRFGGDPGVVGRTLLLDDAPFTVVGVLPASFDLPQGAEIWKPLAHGPDTVPRNFQFLRVVGRLRAGATLQAARSEMEAIAARLAGLHPDSNEGRGVRLQTLQDRLVGEVRPALVVLSGAVLLLLVLACVNVANLLLVHAERRRGEIAVRLALGVSRARLTRQFVIEGLLLAVLGCGLGLLLAVWLSRLLVAFSPREVPRLEGAHVGLPVLLLAMAVALAAGLAFSVLPALWASRQDPGATLRATLPGSGHGRGRRLVSLLVVGQVAAALVLLVGAGLMIESFVHLRSIDPGFEPEGLLTLRISLPEAKYPDAERTNLFFTQLEEGLRRLPGVRSVSFALSPPACPGPKSDNTFAIEGRPEEPGASRTAFIRPVGADYFQTLRIPVLRGRAFTRQDRAGAPAVAVVNQEMARRSFAGANPVGERLTIGASLGSMGTLDTVPRTIVGVVADVRHAGAGQEPVPEVYFPLAQGTWRSMGILVRAQGDPAALTRPAMQAIWSLDPNLPVSDVGTMEQNVAKTIAQPRFYMALLAAFAALAWVLAIAGVYGVVAQAVEQRSGEIGLRLALGAGRPQILRRVLADGLKLALAGVAFGMLAALWLGRALEGLLFGTSPRDPEAFLTVAVLVALAALAASCIPAYRATRVDPLTVLRSD